MVHARPRACSPRLGFTLIELLVVIAIIALLVSILLPALSKARTAGQCAAGSMNMHQLAVASAAYSSENNDSFVNPFDKNNPTLFGGLPWCDIVPDEFRDTPTVTDAWDFGDQGRPTEMFAAFWSSMLMNYINHNDLTSKVFFHPRDRYLLQNYQQLIGKVFGIDYSAYIWEGSYWYSPTLWFKPERYAGAATQYVSTGDSSFWRRNRISDVVFPEAKVMLFERADFTRNDRRALGGGRVKDLPIYSNVESTAEFCLVDGAVNSIKVSNLVTLATSTNPADRNTYAPQGLWDIPTTVLSKYGMQNEGIENGDGTPYYPAYFWATRNGIHGRDYRR